MTASQALVVERASYWPGTIGGASAAAGTETGLADGILAGPAPLAADVGREAGEALGPPPYVLTPVVPADGMSRARAEGRISDEEQAVLAAVAAARAAFLAKAPPGTPSGLAPPGWLGARTEAAGADPVEGVVAPAAAAVSWYGGHLTLGRRP